LRKQKEYLTNKIKTMKKQDPPTPAQKVEKNRKHTVSTYLKCIPPVPGQTQKEYDSTVKSRYDKQRKTSNPQRVKGIPLCNTEGNFAQQTRVKDASMIDTSISKIGPNNPNFGKKV
tara:strand:+ start:408 stop:755 length:348 start_codon:yes stop_codon:yes gene_type:complete